MEENVKSFLDKIQELNDKKITVYPRSSTKSLKGTPITFKQQKDLIGTIADGHIGGLRLQKILNDIILENVDGSDSLKITDKLPIILDLRIASIGGELKILDDVTLQLITYSEKARALQMPAPTTVTYENLEVSLDVPTLKEENKLITAAVESVKKQNDGEVGKNIGNIYTYEICKFITTVKFGDIVVNFSETPIKDRFKLVESLPLVVNKDIILYIQKVRSAESDILVYTIDGQEKSFDIDVAFFDS